MSGGGGSPDIYFAKGGPEDPRTPPGGGSRSPRILGGDRSARNVWIAVASTILFFGVVAVVVVRSPGWPEIKQQFFNGQEFAVSFPLILRKFTRNIFIFCVAEVLVLTLALVLAVLRSLPGPVFTPLRIFSATYTDLFRGVPTILVIVMLGFGAPALNLQGVPTSSFFWAIIALTLVYSAYVAEVYRAGIQSVHPSQVAAARSLGFSRWQSMRYVVLPQAIRRVIPPLLNDFIGLQKDSALVALIGPIEAFRQSQIDVAATFNYTPYLCTALLFVLLTIPMARLTDWVVARDRRRQSAGAR